MANEGNKRRSGGPLSALAALAVLLAGAPASAAQQPPSQSIVDRVGKIRNALKRAGAAGETPVVQEDTEPPHRIFQWSNWPNWPNWPNWNNWRNWNNG